MNYYILLIFGGLALMGFIVVIFINYFAVDQPEKATIIKTLLVNHRLTISYKDGVKRVYVKRNNHWYLTGQQSAANPHLKYKECSRQLNDWIEGIVADIEFEKLEK